MKQLHSIIGTVAAIWSCAIGYADETGPTGSLPPVVHELSPILGPSKGGTRVHFFGEHFSQEAQVFFGNAAALDVQVVSESEISLITPSHPEAKTLISIQQDSGTCLLPQAFAFQEHILGDVDGDQEVTFKDAALALQVSAGADPSQEIFLTGDVNGDGRIGPEEAAFAMAHAEAPNEIFFSELASPKCYLSTPEVVVGGEAMVRVRNVALVAPIELNWGDGHIDQLYDASVYRHTYLTEGEFTIALEGAETTHTVIVTPLPVQVQRVQLSLTGIASDGQLREGRVLDMHPELLMEAPPLLAVQFTGEGGSHVAGYATIERPDGELDSFPLEATIPLAEGGSLHTSTIEVALPVVPIPGVHVIRFQPQGGVSANPAVAFPMPVVVSVAGFVTQRDCEEVERQWRQAVAEKAQKKADCDALQKQIDALKAQKAKLEADKAAQEAKRDAAKKDLADTQKDFDALAKSISDFYKGTAQFINYADSSDFPVGSQHIGVRTRGASTGVGFAFDSAAALLSRNRAYEQVTGNSIGKDLKRLRDMIRKMDGLNDQIDGLNQAINGLAQAIAGIDQAIAALMKLLEDCKKVCGGIDKTIEELVQKHRECLEKLEEQRQSEEKIRDAQRAERDTENAASQASGAGDAADEAVGGHAGSPSEVDGDKAEIGEGRNCEEEAKRRIEDARAKKKAAEDALRNGDPESAGKLAEEARALFEQAKAKLEAARQHYRTATSSARQRKRRECDEEGAERTFVKRWKVWTTLSDVALAPLGYTPETWASTQENAASLIKALSWIAELAPEAGLGGTSLDVEEAATAIVGFYSNYIKRFGLAVWAKRSGNCVTETTTQRCVNGCWQTVSIDTLESPIGPEVAKIGDIEIGDDAQKKLKEILTRYLSQQTRALK